MISVQNSQIQVLFAPRTLVSATTNVSSFVDMIGYGQAEIVLHAASSTTTATPVNLLIQHSDTTDASNLVTIVSAGTATTGWPTQVSNATAVTAQFAPLIRASVPWLNKKRYLAISVTGSTADSCTFASFVVKSHPKVAPTGTNVSAVATNTGQSYVFPVTV